MFLSAVNILQLQKSLILLYILQNNGATILVKISLDAKISDVQFTYLVLHEQLHCENVQEN